MKNLKKQVGELPCKDCITKVICRNELLIEMEQSRNYFREIHVIGSFNRTLAKKCVILNKFIRKAKDIGIHYQTIEEILNDMKLFEIVGLKERIKYLKGLDWERLDVRN